MKRLLLVLLTCLMAVTIIVTSLADIVLPTSVKIIESEAFYGDTSLTEVVIPNGTVEIGKNAFADCPNLYKITVPDSVVTIGEGAFGGYAGLWLVCSEGSAAAAYADAHGILRTDDAAAVQRPTPTPVPSDIITNGMRAYIRTEWMYAIGYELPASYEGLFEMIRAFDDASYDLNGNGKHDEHGLDMAYADDGFALLLPYFPGPESDEAYQRELMALYEESMARGITPAFSYADTFDPYALVLVTDRLPAELAVYYEPLRKGTGGPTPTPPPVYTGMKAYIRTEWMYAIGYELPASYEGLFEMIRAFDDASYDLNGNGKRDEHGLDMAYADDGFALLLPYFPGPESDEAYQRELMALYEESMARGITPAFSYADTFDPCALVLVTDHLPAELTVYYEPLRKGTGGPTLTPPPVYTGMKAYIRTEWMYAIGYELPATYEGLFEMIRAFDDASYDLNGNGKRDEHGLDMAYADDGFALLLPYFQGPESDEAYQRELMALYEESMARGITPAFSYADTFDPCALVLVTDDLPAELTVFYTPISQLV